VKTQRASAAGSSRGHLSARLSARWRTRGTDETTRRGAIRLKVSSRRRPCAAAGDSRCAASRGSASALQAGESSGSGGALPWLEKRLEITLLPRPSRSFTHRVALYAHDTSSRAAAACAHLCANRLTSLQHRRRIFCSKYLDDVASASCEGVTHQNRHRYVLRIAHRILRILLLQAKEAPPAEMTIGLISSRASKHASVSCAAAAERNLSPSAGVPLAYRTRAFATLPPPTATCTLLRCLMRIPHIDIARSRLIAANAGIMTRPGAWRVYGMAARTLSCAHLHLAAHWRPPSNLAYGAPVANGITAKSM